MNLLERRAFYWSEVMQTDMSAQVQAARSGAREAWDALFARYQLPLFAYVRDLVRDREASLDIIQEAFIAAARHLDTLRDAGPVRESREGCDHREQVRPPRRPARPRLRRWPRRVTARKILSLREPWRNQAGQQSDLKIMESKIIATPGCSAMLLYV